MDKEELKTIRQLVEWTKEVKVSEQLEPFSVFLRLATALEYLLNIVERQPADLAKAREQEREQCIKDACYWCEQGRALGKNVAGNFAHADVNGLWTVTCYANAILQRAAREQVV